MMSSIAELKSARERAERENEAQLSDYFWLWLPVMVARGAGQSGANGWSSKCNYPGISGSGEGAPAFGDFS
jgi:hypothetical protein